MRDWELYVRTHLPLPHLTRERESRIVQELASQFEDFYREAVARGMTESDADAFARAQITGLEQPRIHSGGCRSLSRSIAAGSVVGAPSTTAHAQKKGS